MLLILNRGPELCDFFHALLLLVKCFIFRGHAQDMSIELGRWLNHENVQLADMKTRVQSPQTIEKARGDAV